MAVSITQNVTDKGLFKAVCTSTGGDPITVQVGHLRNVTISVRRTAGSTDTASITGSNDNTNFAAVTSKTQVAGADTALTGLTSLSIHALRQLPQYIRLTSSGSTDPFELIVVGNFARG